MYKYSRDIILVVNDEMIHPEPIDRRVEYLNSIIAYVDNVDGFCNAHELVNRNKITSKKSKILKAVKKDPLKPFRFLINKN